MVYLISHDEFRDLARRSRRPDINLEDATYYGMTDERIRDVIRYQDIF